MSYARRGELGSDIYLFMSTGGYLECNACTLMPRMYGNPALVHYGADSTAKMLEHLAAHLAAGDRVPDWVVSELLADDAENFPVT